MWEAIESNRRRSWVLIVLMGALLLALGAVLGRLIHPRQGLVLGVCIASGVWLVLWLVAAFQGDRFMLTMGGAMKIERRDAPQLWNVVEEMTIASGSAKMPDVYVIDDERPNAFAIGRNPEKRSAVAVTSGLLRLLNRDELQGVIAHEIGHLKNRDSAFLVLAGVMLGAIVLLADVFLRGMFFGRRRSRGGGEGQAVVMILALVLAILAPILAQMLYFACSRRREFLADASSARFTRYPAGLASALEKISSRYAGAKQEANRVLAPMYIVNPMSALAAVGLFSTHPPTEKRVEILRGMGGGSAYADYEAAYGKAFGKGSALLGKRTLAADTAAPARAAVPKVESKQDAVARSKDVVQLLGRLEDFLLMTCACGLGIKVPPELKRDSIPCPRCGASNPVPRAEAGGSYHRAHPADWESFRCACGATVLLGPGSTEPEASCRACARKVRIEA